MKSTISKLKALSKGPTNSADIISTLSTLAKEGDRSAIIVCAALVEESLEAFVARQMRVYKSQEHAEIFRGTGLLASFSAKIKIASAFGLVGKNTHRDLVLIKEIRNAVAHARRPVSFESAAIVAACALLEDPDPDKKIKKMLSAFDSSNPRTRFQMRCLSMQTTFLFAYSDIMCLDRPIVP